MEKVLLFAIGLGALWYLTKTMWKEAKGEVQCNCAHNGSCGKKGQGCSH